MIPPITGIDAYVGANGRLTLSGQQLMQEMVKEIEANASVLGDQQTGWVAPTGIASRATFDPATVTLSELGKRLKALIDDLTTHGLIGP